MRVLTRGLLTVAALVPLIGIGLAASADVQAAPPTFPAPVNHLRLFAQTNGGGDSQQIYSQAEAVALAKRFDVIVGLRWTFDEHVPAMRAANPRLRLLVYMNGAMSRPADRAGMPEAWFFHDAAGQRVRNLHFDLQYMDVGNEGWRRWTSARCAEWIRLSGFDGCFLDDMGAGNLGTNLSAWPIDPRTGAKITEANFIGYGRGQLAIVQSGNPNHMVTSNGLNNGSHYFGTTGSGRLLDTSIASAAEGWLRGSYDSASKFRAVDAWKRDVDMLVDAGARGKSTLLGTKLWTTASAAQQAQWRLYTYASFLLGTNGKQFLNFNVRGAGKPDAPNALESINIGTPSEPYALRAGVYQRRYSAGLAMVNPGASTVTVNLGASYRLPTGEVRTSVTMAPNTGLVLQSTGTTVALPAPTTAPATTAPATTAPATTAPATTAPATTAPATTAPPTTAPPTTAPPTTAPPTTAPPTTTSPNEPDTTPPEGFLAIPVKHEVLTTATPTFSGVASDDRGVDRVNVTVRNLSTMEYLRADGTWQLAFAQFPAELSISGWTSTVWSVVAPAPLPNGAYRYEVRAFDTSGNLDPTRPSAPFSVSV